MFKKQFLGVISDKTNPKNILETEVIHPWLIKIPK
jgi:hypothetical protein